jgi:ubiquinone/menaquinone biosynthesis C-methylase UbiE
VRTGHPWAAATLDLAMRPLWPARRLVVPDARGDVLEIGVGTGLNLALYDPAAVRRIVGVEPDPHMLRRARAKAAALGTPVELHEACAERLPFRAEQFDTAVVTWSLCTIPDAARALAEVRRVLKPRGRLLFIEHARSIQPALARVQEWMTPLWMRLTGGCHLDRPAVDLVRDSGLSVTAVASVGRERWTLLPIYRGTAVKVAGEG